MWSKCYTHAVCLESCLTCKIETVAAKVSNQSSGSTAGALTKARRNGDYRGLLREILRTTGVSQDKGGEGVPEKMVQNQAW